MILTLIIFIYLNSKYSLGASIPFNAETPDLNLLLDRNFVDKSDIIKAFFRADPVTMVTAPRLFGKSVNMEIIKKFCEITVNEYGDPVEREVTDNYKLFKRHNLNIFRDSDFFSNFFGMYPVIFLDFKILSLTDYQSFVTSARQLITATFRSHKYLLYSRNLGSEAKYHFNNYYDENNMKQIEDSDIYKGVLTLSHLLYDHFNEKQCIVLIDNFDTPAVREIFNTDDTIFMDIFFLLLSIISKSDVNPFVERTLINSCLPLGPLKQSEGDFIKYKSFLSDHSFSMFYGFTENEVLHLHSRVWTPYEINTVRDWFGGYKTKQCNGYFYNPYSVAKYLESEQLSHYWCKMIDTRNAQKILLHRDLQKDMYSLIAYNFTKINYVDVLTPDHLLRLKTVFDATKQFNSSKDVDLFLQFMTHLGFFNIEFRKSNVVQLEIPNMEVEHYLEEATALID